MSSTSPPETQRFAGSTPALATIRIPCSAMTFGARQARDLWITYLIGPFEGMCSGIVTLARRGSEGCPVLPSGMARQARARRDHVGRTVHLRGA